MRRIVVTHNTLANYRNSRDARVLASVFVCVCEFVIDIRMCLVLVYECLCVCVCSETANTRTRRIQLGTCWAGAPVG